MSAASVGREPEEALRAFFIDLGPGLQADLLRVLRAPADVRADVIRQFYERPGKQGWAEVLMDLEEDDFALAAVVAILEELQDVSP